MYKDGVLNLNKWYQGMTKHPYKILLSQQGKNKGKFFTILDKEDFEKYSEKRWYINCGYACNRSAKVNGKKKTILLHRALMECPKGMEVDHINGNPLDNRKENLRICTTKENKRNQSIQNNAKKTSQFKGVDFYPAYSKWRSGIKTNGKKIHLGYFNSEVEAAKSYDLKALEIFGEFAKTNFKNYV